MPSTKASEHLFFEDEGSREFDQIYEAVWDGGTLRRAE